MQVKEAVSIDIGSTYTKGALFSYDRDRGIHLEERLELPTDRGDSSRSCTEIFRTLKKMCRTRTAAVSCTSSVHGGLTMAVIGLVPSYTQRAAREAALSSGAKVILSFSYRLIEQDISRIEEASPDIILLTGGTDGGNISYIEENARLLSRLSIPAVVLYAGNRDASAAAQTFFARSGGPAELVICRNILPTLGDPQMHEVRSRIKNLFMERIILGKGLESVYSFTGAKPVPTPGRIFEMFLEFDSSRRDARGDWCCVDIGGATTDCYSAVRQPLCTSYGQAPVFHTGGTAQQRVSRTVEGDLGMRMSASAVLDHILRTCSHDDAASDKVMQECSRYVSRIEHDFSLLPCGSKEEEAELQLASACFNLALARHAGYLKPIYTHEGLAYTQFGRNLSDVKTIILSGGAVRSLLCRIPAASHKAERTDSLISLTPKSAACLYDTEHLLPLVSGLTGIMPLEALQDFFWDRLAVDMKPTLEKFSISEDKNTDG